MGGIEIAEGLPRTLMFDTGVVLRAFYPEGENDRNYRAECVALARAAQRQGCRILIAAPTMAEILRTPGRGAIPSLRAVTVVAFDAFAARRTAEAFPLDHIKAEAARTQSSRPFLKFDAMIVGAASRWEAVLVSIDTRMAQPKIEVDVRHVKTFLDPKYLRLFADHGTAETGDEGALDEP